jgi:hypothetical protein
MPALLTSTSMVPLSRTAAWTDSGSSHVELHDRGRQPLALDRLAQLGGRVRGAHAGPDVILRAGEMKGGGEADAAAAAGDERDGHDGDLLWG